MVWYAWAMVALLALNVVASISLIDRPRKPLDAATAIATLVTNSLYVWAIVSLAT